MKCPICANGMAVAGDRFDDRYGYSGRYRLYRCSACGHTQTDATLTAEQISTLYTDYYPRSERSLDSWTVPAEEVGIRSWWRGSRASAFRWVPPAVRVLDIGCGFGETLGYHRARGCEAHGVEADRNILRVAERHGLNVQVGLFDPGCYAPASLDVVTLDQVIEHVSDPLGVLRGIHQVLKPGGTLILSTPNADGWGARVFGRRWIHWHAPYHQQFFSRRSMREAAAKSGLELQRTKTITNSAWLDFQWGHLVTFPPPGQPSVYWSSRLKRSIGQRVALRLFRWIDSAGVNSLITRIFDGLRLGDNVVYILRRPM